MVVIDIQLGAHALNLPAGRHLLVWFSASGDDALVVFYVFLFFL